jgi:flagellin-like protein
LAKPWLVLRKNEEGVSPVIATILMVAITVVLAAVLYVMVLGFADQDDRTVDPMGVDVDLSDDGSTWIVLIVDASAGKQLGTTTLSISSGSGEIALGTTPLSTFLTEASGVLYQRNDNTSAAVNVGDSILIDSSLYPSGYSIQISDGSAILVKTGLA